LYEKGFGKRVLLTSEHLLNSRVAPLFLTNEQKAEKIARPLNVQVEFMKKWWDLSPKVASAALAHHGKGPVKEEPLTLNQVVGTANRIANIHPITHPPLKISPKKGIWMPCKSVRRIWISLLIPRKSY
jgi:hypothetical protein